MIIMTEIEFDGDERWTRACVINLSFVIFLYFALLQKNTTCHGVHSRILREIWLFKNSYSASLEEKNTKKMEEGEGMHMRKPCSKRKKTHCRINSVEYYLKCWPFCFVLFLFLRSSLFSTCYSHTILDHWQRLIWLRYMCQITSWYLKGLTKYSNSLFYTIFFTSWLWQFFIFGRASFWKYKIWPQTVRLQMQREVVGPWRVWFSIWLLPCVIGY